MEWLKLNFASCVVRLCFTNIIKNKIHSSCEIEYFVETHLVQAVCDTPIACISGCVSSLRIYVGDSPCNYSVAIRVNRVLLGSLCAETIKKPVL